MTRKPQLQATMACGSSERRTCNLPLITGEASTLCKHMCFCLNRSVIHCPPGRSERPEFVFFDTSAQSSQAASATTPILDDPWQCRSPCLQKEDPWTADAWASAVPQDCQRVGDARSVHASSICTVKIVSRQARRGAVVCVLPVSRSNRYVV